MISLIIFIVSLVLHEIGHCLAAYVFGVKINKLFEQYNGGGHVYACGAKLNSFSEADEIIEKLDELCMEYKEDE